VLSHPRAHVKRSDGAVSLPGETGNLRQRKEGDMALHHHDTERTVVRDDTGPSALLVAIVILLLVGFLIWLFAFSGIVFDRDTTTNEGPTITNNNPIDNTDSGGTGTGTDTGGTDTGTNPSP
jgi:hypothetical protein